MYNVAIAKGGEAVQVMVELVFWPAVSPWPVALNDSMADELTWVMSCFWLAAGGN